MSILSSKMLNSDGLLLLPCRPAARWCWLAAGAGLLAAGAGRLAAGAGRLVAGAGLLAAGAGLLAAGAGLLVAAGAGWLVPSRLLPTRPACLAGWNPNQAGLGGGG